MKHKRDFKALQQRRLKGAKLLARGMSKPEVARELGVARQTAATPEQRLAEGGKEALKRGERSRPRQLDAEQERELGKVPMAGFSCQQPGKRAAISCTSGKAPRMRGFNRAANAGGPEPYNAPKGAAGLLGMKAIRP